jgi:hypothetical protein
MNDAFVNPFTSDITKTVGKYAGHDGQRVFIQIGGTTDTIWFYHQCSSFAFLATKQGHDCTVITNNRTGVNTLTWN